MINQLTLNWPSFWNHWASTTESIYRWGSLRLMRRVSIPKTGIQSTQSL